MTELDFMEMEKNKERTGMENIAEVFTGDHRGGFSIFWLFPTAINSPLILEKQYYWDRILGRHYI